MLIVFRVQSVVAIWGVRLCHLFLLQFQNCSQSGKDSSILARLYDVPVEVRSHVYDTKSSPGLRSTAKIAGHCFWINQGSIQKDLLKDAVQ